MYPEITLTVPLRNEYHPDIKIMNDVTFYQILFWASLVVNWRYHLIQGVPNKHGNKETNSKSFLQIISIVLNNFNN